MEPTTLKQRLALLEDDSNTHLDAEDAYASLDTVNLFKGQQGEDDAYLDVGPSRLRNELGNRDQVLSSDKYAGKTVRRKKIFDDDDEESSEDDGLNGIDGVNGMSEDEDDDGSSGRDHDDGELYEDDVLRAGSPRAVRNGADSRGKDGDLYGDEDEYEDDGEDDYEGEGNEDEDPNDALADEDGQDDDRSPQAGLSHDRSRRGMDPVGALREARAKDIERGRGIRRQKVRPLSSPSPLWKLADLQVGIVRRRGSSPNNLSKGASCFPSPVLAPSS